jgi:hypothetical protein
MKIQAAVYRSALKFLIITVMLSLFASPLHAASSQDSNAEFDSLANEFFNAMKNKEFTKVAGLFHYPAEDTEQKRDGNKKGILVTLEYAQKEFGTIVSHAPYEKEVETFNFSLNSGTKAYWEKHPENMQKRYKVAFDTSGEGYISLVLCNIQNKWEIRTIKYEKEASEESRKFILNVIDTFRRDIVPLLQPELYKPKIQSIRPNI